MEFFEDIIDAIQSDLTVGDESSLFDLATVKLAANRAYRKIGASFKWEETRDALQTSTQENLEYYDYPPNWRPNSIWKLMIDDVDYGDPLGFKDYQYERENSLPSGAERIWTNYGKRWFAYRKSGEFADGSNNVKVWGHKFVDLMEIDTDITIFSYSYPELNEAIVLEAGAILKMKGDVEKGGKSDTAIGMDLISPEAKGIVITVWTKVSQEKAKLEHTIPQWDVPDYYAHGAGGRNILRNRIGNF